jgi:spore germination cell wall hydrolase CwlJ-like protein
MSSNVATALAPAPQRSSLERWLVLAIAAMLIALLASLGADRLVQAFQQFTGQSQAEPTRPTQAQLGAVAAMSVDDQAQIVVEGARAQSQNAAIPLLGLPLEQVKAFGLTAARNETYQTALRCLTQAVYYEAAVEPLGGRRAVAQVVLNRVRHPAYPNSVCGVVYQGAERRTGCQFSFTCDGSLLRAPSQRPWREAEQIAIAALAGHVEPSVGTATHYHADYVLPKWAFELGKISQIGRHIFYRFGGTWGTARFFTSRYAGTEAIPAINLMALRERALADGMEIGEVAPAESFTPGLTVAPHVTDRHAPSDVGGRIDMTKTWRPSIPDPVSTGGRLSEVVAQTATGGATQPVAASQTGGSNAPQ